MTEPSYDAFYNDWGGGNAISGWIVAEPSIDVESVALEALLDDQPIGRAFGAPRVADGRSRFRIECTADIKAIDIVIGKLAIFAALPGQPRKKVDAHKNLLTWMAKVSFTENIYEYMRDVESAKFVLGLIESRFGRDVFGDRHAQAALKSPTCIDDVTEMLHRTGTISADRSAILGRKGTILLYEGNNRLFTQYSEISLGTSAEKARSGWIEAIQGRVRYFANKHIPFLQVIIPEKSSLSPDLFPEVIRTPTLLFSSIESWAGDPAQKIEPHFVSILNKFRESAEHEKIFLKTDSHLSAYGAMITTKIILEALSEQHPAILQSLEAIDAIIDRVRLPTTPKRLFSGDLARRFFDVPLYEEDLDVRYETLFSGKSTVTLEKETMPPGGPGKGLKMVWRHGDAPLKLRVVVFGNSFFERGALCHNLSWWFKHLCQEFHFVWSKEVDRGYVDEVRPDVVICQTIERFLLVSPTS